MDRRIREQIFEKDPHTESPIPMTIYRARSKVVRADRYLSSPLLSVGGCHGFAT